MFSEDRERVHWEQMSLRTKMKAQSKTTDALLSKSQLTKKVVSASLLWPTVTNAKSCNVNLL